MRVDQTSSDGMSRAVHVARFVRCICRYIFLPTLLQTLNTFTCLSYIMFLGIWILCILPVLSDVTVDDMYIFLLTQLQTRNTFICLFYVMFLGICIFCILPVLSDLTVDTSFCPICRQRSYKHKTHLSAPYVMFLGVLCNALSFTRPFNLPR